MGDGFCLPGGSLMFLFRLLEMTSCLSSHQRQALLKLVEKVLGRSVYWQAARQVGVAQVSDQADLVLSSGVNVWWGGEGRDVYERDPVGQCIQKIFGNHEVLL